MPPQSDFQGRDAALPHLVEVNPAFIVSTGLEAPTGRSIREMVPGIEKSWVETYGNVALTGEGIRFESRAAALQDRWYEVYAFPVGDPALHRVAVLFNDVSAPVGPERERHETADAGGGPAGRDRAAGTETFLMQDSRATAVVLRELKDLGINLALDDFGTGYSSLSYMRRFPIDALKVDRSFVCNLTTDVDDASVVSAVINMGKSLHMRVVAEGVESRAQLEFLEDHGCTEAQGYYFGAPCSAGAFVGLLAGGE